MLNGVSPDEGCVYSTGKNRPCKRALPLGRRKVYADMKGDEHKDKDTPEKCETINWGEKLAMPTHGGHEQKSSHVHSYRILYRKERGARMMHAASNHRRYVQSTMQKYLPGAISDP